MREYEKRAIIFAGVGAWACVAAGVLCWEISISQAHVFIKYILLGLVVAVAFGALLISLKIAIIGKIEEQNFAMANVNGYPLGMIKNIIALTWKEALEAGLLGPKSVAIGEADINLPADIQKNMDLLFAWLETPTHQKGFKTGMELLNFLEFARKRVEYYQEMQ